MEIDLHLCPITTLDHQEWPDKDTSTILPPEAYSPNRASMDAALEASLQQGITPRVFLLSHPQNPLGMHWADGRTCSAHAGSDGSRIRDSFLQLPRC